MKTLSQFVNESNLTKEEVRKDYDIVDGLDSKKEKQEYAKKYGVDSVKKEDIKMAILLKLREFRKTATQFDEEDWYEFRRLSGYSVQKLPEYLKEENPKFVTWLQEYYKGKYMKGRLANWIGINPGNNTFGLSYADRDTIKYYNKILTFIQENTPKTRTVKDEIFDSLVNKFTDLLADYKEEYLKRVANFAKKRFTEVFPKDLEELKSKRKESSDRLDKIDWRKNRLEYNKEYKIYSSLNSKIERLAKILEKYTEKTYTEECVKHATEEFEASIKELASRIMKDELEVDKLDVKSVHDDPKIFKMKITDGTKNLYCRSIIAAMNSSYMIPHYRFIITNRSKDDSHYND